MMRERMRREGKALKLFKSVFTDVYGRVFLAWVGCPKCFGRGYKSFNKTFQRHDQCQCVKWTETPIHWIYL
jgi:hypothetical protein